METDFNTDFAAEVAQTQSAVIAYSTIAGGLAKLRQCFAGVVFDVSTNKGLEEAKAARLEIRGPRYKLEKLRKEAKAPLIKIGSLIDREAERITAELMKIETPIHQQIQQEEDRREEEKAEKRRVEEARIAAIRVKINALGNEVVSVAGSAAGEIRAALVRLHAAPITIEEYAEFTGEAQALGLTVVASLEAMATAREKQDADDAKRAVELRLEQARILSERMELARERVEVEEADRKAAAAIAAEREELARQRREIEQARAAQEIAATPAEPLPSAPEPVALGMKKLEAPKLIRPSDEEIIYAISVFFDADAVTVERWLAEGDWQERIIDDGLVVERKAT